MSQDCCGSPFHPALPSAQRPHLGEALSGLCPGWGAGEEAHLPKGLGSKVQGSPTLPQRCTPPPPGRRLRLGTAASLVMALPRPHGVNDENQTSPPASAPPFFCFLIFFSIKISLCCSSIKAWRINMWSGGRETPGFKSPGCPHPGSINPGLLSKEWFSVNLSYQQKPLKEFV